MTTARIHSAASTFTLPPESRDSALERVVAFAKVALPGKWLRITVEERKRTRSHEQNAYLWGVCYETLRQATGQDAEDWHEFFLGEFFGWEERELFGKRRLKPVRRSSKLSTVEFADYVGFIQQRAAENGIYIPDPGERWAA
jgi:hypothetical protein